MSGLKQFISHSQKSSSSPRLLPIDLAWYILPHSPFYREKAVSRLTVGCSLLWVSLSWVCELWSGVWACRSYRRVHSNVLSQLHNSHDFLFSRVSAKVYAVDCSRVITMSWDCSTTLCSLSPERCLSLWPRLGSCCHLMQTVVGQGPSHVRAVPVPGFVRQWCVCLWHGGRLMATGWGEQWTLDSQGWVQTKYMKLRV